MTGIRSALHTGGTLILGSAETALGLDDKYGRRVQGASVFYEAIWKDSVIKTFDIAPHADTAIQVVQDVFKTMLYSDVRESSSEDYNTRSTEITAAIFFNRKWRGAAYMSAANNKHCFSHNN